MLMERLKGWLKSLAMPREPGAARHGFMLNIILLGMLVAVGLFFPVELLGWLTGQVRTSLFLTTAGALFIVIMLYVLSRQGRYRLAAVGLLTFLILIAGGTLFTVGITGVSVMVLILVVLIAGTMLGVRGAIAVSVVQSILYLAIGLIHERGLYTPEPRAGLLSYWATLTVIMFMSGLITWLSSRQLEQALENAQRSAEESRAKGLELEVHRQRLENIIEERTHDLAHRLRYLEVTALVAREATAIFDPQALLSRVTTLISERLGFYHAAIFLLDETGKWAVLQAASSEGGQQMLERGYQLQVGAQSIVGQVTEQGQPRLALDTGVDAVRFDNPDLPNTRSELALPLRARGEIIGMLDVQSAEEDSFSAEAVEALQTLADQVALSISNARLFQQIQKSLEIERRAYGELSREGWRELLRTRTGTGQRYDPQGILPDGGQWREEMKVAAREGKTVLGETLPLSSPVAGRTLATPIKVRDQVIGVLDAHKPAGAGEWTTSEIALLETLTERLSLTLESARLFQDTRRRAAREQLIGEITARMRETLDVDTMLQTAIREIGQALGKAEVEVRMGSGVPLAQLTGADDGGHGAEEEVRS